MPLHTLAIAAPLGFLFMALGVGISLMRLAGKGTPENASFQRLVRTHGNAAEHIPLALVLLLALEAGGAGQAIILGVGGAFVLARLLHASGYLIRRRHPLQFIGSTITYLVETALAGLCAYFYLAR